MRMEIDSMFEKLLEYGVPSKIAKIAYKIYREGNQKFNLGESIYFTGESGAGKTISSVLALIYHIEQWKLHPKSWNDPRAAIFIKENDIVESIKNSYSRPNIIIRDYDETIEENPYREQKDFVFTASEILIKRYKEVELLIVDDFGIDKTTDWSYVMLYSILVARYEWERQIIFTSNYSLNELAEKLQDIRLTNRISDWCTIVQMKNRDFRKK